MEHVLGDQLPGRGDAMLSEARADHRACAPGNLHRMLLDVSHATASHRDLKSLLCDLAGLLRRVARFDRLDAVRSEEHTSELQSRVDLVCRLLLEKKNTKEIICNVT